MYPLSYYVFPLIILYFFNKTYASYFYPFVLLTTSIGILTLLLLIFYPGFDKVYYGFYPNAITASMSDDNTKLIINWSLIIVKIIIEAMWPKNISIQSFLISISYLAFYIFLYVVYFTIKLYKSG